VGEEETPPGGGVFLAIATFAFFAATPRKLRIFPGRHIFMVIQSKTLSIIFNIN
jgi:hypothetical protein